MRRIFNIWTWVSCLLVTLPSAEPRILIVDNHNQVVDDFPNEYATDVEYQIEGCLEASEPSDACTEIRHPTFPQNFTMKKIVLVNGTATCDFMTKVKNAEAVGYDAVMLFNPFPGSFEYPNLTFPLDSDFVNSSVVMVLYEDAIRIKKFLYNSSSEKEYFTFHIFESSFYYKYALYIQISLGLGVFLLGKYFFLSLFKSLRWLYRKCKDQYTETEEGDADEEIERLRNMMIDLLREHSTIANTLRQQGARRIKSTFPARKFSIGDEDGVCVICTEKFEVGDIIRVLECCHVFHADCIDQWLAAKLGSLCCPLCKRNYSLESSCSQSSTEDAGFLTNPSASRGNGSGPSNQLEPPYQTPDQSFSDTTDLVACVQGSVNSFQIDSDDERQPLV